MLLRFTLNVNFGVDAQLQKLLQTATSTEIQDSELCDQMLIIFDFCSLFTFVFAFCFGIELAIFIVTVV